MNANTSFLESHVRALYRILNHSGLYSRVGSFDYATKKYSQEFVKGEEEVIRYARQYNGTRNCFIGRAARNHDGSVHSCYVASFDIDPIREKGTASTHEQHRQSIDAARLISNKVSGSYVASSGNGCLILYSLREPISDLHLHYSREGLLIKELQKEVQHLNVKIDATNYAEAVIKLIGTQSTKGDVSLRRCSQWLENPIPPYKSSSILHELTKFSVVETQENKKIDISSIKNSFNGDRSAADYALVSFCKQQGLKAQDAVKALEANPLGRKTDEKDQARLISKIYGSEVLREGSTNTTGSYFTELFTEKKDSNDGIRTGFGSLDKELGVFPKGELVTIAARTGYGKSTFACTVAEYLRRASKRVLYFSTEMSRTYIMHKFTAIGSGTPLTSLVQQNVDVYRDKIIKYQEEFEKFPTEICDEFQPTIEKVRTEVIRYRPDLVIVDHVSHLETHWEKLAQYLKSLKDLTNQEQCVTMLLAQMNDPPRGKDGNETKSIRGDVRGTHEVVNLSGIFMYLTNPYEVKGQFQPVECHVAKNRYGISGQVISLSVDKVVSKFIEGNNNEQVL